MKEPYKKIVPSKASKKICNAISVFISFFLLWSEVLCAQQIYILIITPKYMYYCIKNGNNRLPSARTPILIGHIERKKRRKQPVFYIRSNSATFQNYILWFPKRMIPLVIRRQLLLLPQTSSSCFCIFFLESACTLRTLQPLWHTWIKKVLKARKNYSMGLIHTCFMGSFFTKSPIGTSIFFPFHFIATARWHNLYKQAWTILKWIKLK